MTVDGVAKLAQYASEGLPIIFTGGLPGYNFYGINATGASYVNKTLSSLTTYANVYVVPYDGLADSLASIGIYPATQVDANRTIYTYWRELPSGDMKSYVYIYNDATGIPFPGGTANGTITFAATGRPVLYDAWTGDETPLTVYSSTDSTITVPLTLAGNQTTIIGFRRAKASKPSLSYYPDGALSVGPRTTHNGSTRVVIKTAVSTPITLTDWTLTIESWAPPADLYTLQAAKSNETYEIPTLVPWHSIDGADLQNVSGRGYYSAQFTWKPKTMNSTGAFIDLGAIVHTARVTINGQALPPLDVTWARADIGRYLKAGVNTVEVVVATTLGNAVRTVWADIRSAGGSPSQGSPFLPSTADYGLLYPVVIYPYNTISMSI